MVTILVVDDEPPICTLLADILTDEGYGVLTAGNGRQALQVMATTPIDLVLTDLMMPVMDGLALCHQLTTNPTTTHVPVVLFSAAKAEAIPQTCSYAAFLRKPFQLDHLLTVLNQTLTNAAKP